MTEPKTLELSDAEARDLVDYMRNQYLNPNKWPTLNAMLDRIESALRHAERPAAE